MINVRYPGYQVAVYDKGKIRSTGAVPYLHGGIVGTVLPVVEKTNNKNK